MLESDFFKRSRPDFHKLSDFGFRKRTGGHTGSGDHACPDVLTYSEPLPGGQFRAELDISEDGEISGRVIDLDTGEEYLPVRFENQLGAFSGSVRELYLDFLAKIDRKCFVPVSFIYDQSNRIEARIHREFDVSAEFLWEKHPGNGIFKCRENGKWFGAVLTVAFSKLDGLGNTLKPHDEEDIVEVIDLKADPEEIPELVKRPGICHAWHMNKTHWISVILDDTLPDDEIFELIRKSYTLAAEGKSAKAKSTGAWMIPSNPKVYDVDAGFRRGKGVIEWHQHNQIHPGDEVFIYCSAPYSALIYRCEVLESDLPYHGMFKDSKGYTKSMRIRLIEKYPPDKYPLSFIKAHGGSVVRSARTMPAELYVAIKADR